MFPTSPPQPQYGGDIGNLVTSGITGVRFGMTLTWAVLVGTFGMALFAEMAGRVIAAARFHLVCLASVIAATAFTLTTSGRFEPRAAGRATRS